MGHTATTVDAGTPGSAGGAERTPLWLSGESGKTTVVELAGPEISAVAEQLMAQIRNEMEQLDRTFAPNWGEQGALLHLHGMLSKLEDLSEAHIEGVPIAVEVDIAAFRTLVRRAANEYGDEVADMLRGERDTRRLDTARRHYAAAVSILERIGWGTSGDAGMDADDEAAEIDRIRTLARVLA
jgi:hypothetical protein